MGNCLAISKLNRALCIKGVAGKHQKFVQVVKMDGEIMKFTTSIPVNDLLVNFPGLGVWSSRKASDCLPLSYELKLGNTYYLLPLISSFQVEHSPGKVLQGIDTEENCSIKRIKLVITKQQLQQLLSKQISFDDVISGMHTGACSVDSPRCWKPELEAIPEGNELCCFA